MSKRSITVTLEKAIEWYNSDNATLKEVALQAFNEKELSAFDFRKIKTFKDALLCFHEYDNIVETVNKLRVMSKASAAMFMLNIVRKVLNTGYNLHLTKNTEGQNHIWYPYFRFITKNSTFYKDELRHSKYKKLGEMSSEGITYTILGGRTFFSTSIGLGDFYSYYGVGRADAGIGFLGCATEEIAKHFGEYFGMLIIEAMYGDTDDFRILCKKEFDFNSNL